MRAFYQIILLASIMVCAAFHWDGRVAVTQRRFSLHMSEGREGRERVSVFDTPEEVGGEVCREILAMAKAEIALKGSFFLAVPGGSVLKLLAPLKDAADAVDWSKVYLFYVNHKCVPDDDPTSTHFKAQHLFLNAIQCNAFPPGAGAGAPGAGVDEGQMQIQKGHNTDAHLYAAHLQMLPTGSKGSLPTFDYMLLGVGKDGHIGSLYPGGKDLYSDEWVVAVDRKSPSSITLTLPVINNAKTIRIVMMGGDKAEAVRCGVTKAKAVAEFPVCGVEGEVRWIVDAPSARLL
ncbi:glucosamine-6-phosphate isomerases/6-phosphogluconolactonase-domain-containing protein [Ochromonadaceae sp. CCMP2298]|nr:glucosamine-6-phosphate isomerases/6-phosphogluconolactonase-domain-containing protein [Ochromonadaceae sp. CCMP2298]